MVFFSNIFISSNKRTIIGLHTLRSAKNPLVFSSNGNYTTEMLQPTPSTFLRTLFVAFLVAGVSVAFAPTDAQAQDMSKMSLPEAKNSVYVELAGNGLLYTVNYDRFFTPKITGRVGVMRAGVSDVSLTAIPLMGNYLVGSGGHKLELGLGPQILRVGIDVEGGDGFAGFDEEVTTIAGSATIGYRYQSMDGGFVFRVGFTPMFSQFGFQPWAGLSLGYAF